MSNTVLLNCNSYGDGVIRDHYLLVFIKKQLFVPKRHFTLGNSFVNFFIELAAND